MGKRSDFVGEPTEIEITPEMTKAGVVELESWIGTLLYPTTQQLSEAVEAIYLAMAFMRL